MSRASLQTVEARFNRGWVLEPITGCWLWTRSLSCGYAQLSTTGSSGPIRLHRWSLERKLGRSLHEGMHALHKCHTRRCVNPEHLYEGTHADNMHDMKIAGHTHRRLTHCKHGHEFTPDNLVGSKRGYRICKKCQERHRRNYLCYIEQTLAQS